MPPPYEPPRTHLSTWEPKTPAERSKDEVNRELAANYRLRQDLQAMTENYQRVARQNVELSYQLDAARRGPPPVPVPLSMPPGPPPPTNAAGFTDLEYGRINQVLPTSF